MSDSDSDTVDSYVISSAELKEQAQQSAVIDAEQKRLHREGENDCPSPLLGVRWDTLTKTQAYDKLFIRNGEFVGQLVNPGKICKWETTDSKFGPSHILSIQSPCTSAKASFQV